MAKGKLDKLQNNFLEMYCFCKSTDCLWVACMAGVKTWQPFKVCCQTNPTFLLMKVHFLSPLCYYLESHLHPFKSVVGFVQLRLNVRLSFGACISWKYFTTSWLILWSPISHQLWIMVLSKPEVGQRKPSIECLPISSQKPPHMPHIVICRRLRRLCIEFCHCEFSWCWS